ncbi:hypothetical protein C922_05871 [Plasmodium inui San Antonio 1]|uniref:Uncharacterized protein n=1 Tax=Plasmodium inui San Antonio 1 TaxID=1237626 RepID=W6ZWR4_9APIC|nr:hypothetical protein C922_05871 [Plasmodium inui San Antonio 1]EUD60465.1 hypothetical protein C922_05871 [Plasmodium inui San Antonio 1]
MKVVTMRMITMRMRREDENHEDEDNPDEDDNCYQGRSYYPSGARTYENRQEFAYYDHEEQSQTH